MRLQISADTCQPYQNRGGGGGLQGTVNWLRGHGLGPDQMRASSGAAGIDRLQLQLTQYASVVMFEDQVMII
jgi:hypothetical protein